MSKDDILYHSDSLPFLHKDCKEGSDIEESTKQYHKCTDVVLTDLLRGGDRHAFTEIYNRYWTIMYVHVYKMLRDEEEAKDIIQEIFSNLWLKASHIKSSHNVSGLLYTAARNRVFNLIEQSRVRGDYVQSIAAFTHQVDPNTVDRVDEKQLIAVIEYEIQNLPPKMRQIFEMSRKDDLSHQEIATKLNLSYQTVKKQVQNALKIIKPKIDELGVSIAILLLLR